MLLPSGRHRYVHLADAVRLALLWREGGIYLDTDIIVLRPLNELRNAVAEEKWEGSHRSLSNAVMAFEPHHPFLWACMEEFAAHFQPFGRARSFPELLQLGLWGQNGPKLLDRVLKRYDNGTRADGSQQGRGVRVLQTNSFYQVPPNDILRHYRKGQGQQLVEDLHKSGAFGLHLWNQVTRGFHPEYGSAVETLLRRSAPSSCVPSPGQGSDPGACVPKL